MQWLVDLSEKSPEVLALLIVLVIGLIGLAIALVMVYITRGTSRRDEGIVGLANGTLELNRDSLKVNEKQLGVIEILAGAFNKHEAEEAAREKRGIDRHESLMLIMERMIQGQGAIVSTVAKGTQSITEKIEKLGIVMSDHTNSTPTIADLVLAIEELGKKIDHVDQNVTAIKDEFGVIKTQVEKKVTAEHPAVEIPIVEEPKDKDATNDTA